MSNIFLLLGIISSDTATFSKSQGVCPSDWVHLDSHCLYLSNDSVTWPIAVKRCEKMEAQLASISDAEAVRGYVHQHFNGSSFWLGATDTEEKDTWRWQSGEKLSENFPWGINPHNTTQPLGIRQHCMVLKYFKNSKTHIYVDNRCKIKWRYICERQSISKSAECSSNCDHGICSGPNSCQCDKGYTGLACDVPECSSDCVHGVCTGPNSCQCNEGYTGLACDVPECSPECEHGVCLGSNTCQCDEGYTGLVCDVGSNQSVTANEDNWRYSWTSPGYDGIKNYPDVDYEATLSITIPAKFDMYVVTAKFESSSSIFETRGCEGDRVTYTHSKGEFKKLYCGDLAGESFTEVAWKDGPKTFQLTWTSVKDGHEDLGWNMTLHGYVPKRK